MDDIALVLHVRFYRTDSGVEPVREWLYELEAEARKSIGEDIKTMQFGWPLGMPLVRKLEPGLWEVRSSLRAGIARVMFTVVGDTMVLLHGFVKKSQKTLLTEITTARRRFREVQQKDADDEQTYRQRF